MMEVAINEEMKHMPMDSDLMEEARCEEMKSERGPVREEVGEPEEAACNVVSQDGGKAAAEEEEHSECAQFLVEGLSDEEVDWQLFVQTVKAAHCPVKRDCYDYCNQISHHQKYSFLRGAGAVNYDKHTAKDDTAHRK
ncbi:uncharacterized protein LOC143829300 [Paroedura picta]|uniref:uncharacterized protein LOC143829300 n=1 Tax=Paroedura picta TaxID=143630 RepID=UPI004056D51C